MCWSYIIQSSLDHTSHMSGVSISPLIIITSYLIRIFKFFVDFVEVGHVLRKSTDWHSGSFFFANEYVDAKLPHMKR